MVSRLVFVAMVVLVACGVEARNVVKRQANQNNFGGPCQPNTKRVDPQDCSRFIECDAEGSIHVKHCGTGTHFSEQLGYCEWPSLITNQNCVVQQSSEIRQDVANLCAENPNGNKSQSWKVAHPQWCNSYFTCSPGYIHEWCTFCGEGTYFANSGSNCGMNPGGQTQDFCGNRQYVAHDMKVKLTLSAQCNTLVNPVLPGIGSNNNNNGYNNNNNNNNNGFNNNNLG